MIRIAFDVGGVLSKYKQFRKLANTLANTPGFDVFVISDIHPKEEIVKQLKTNGIEDVWSTNVFSADYNKYGEACKAVLCKELKIDILIDDFIGYVADGDFIRLLVMPNSKLPYWSDDWKVDTESNFGRRKFNG